MNIIFFETLNSTNIYAKEHLEELNHFDVILTNSQTDGYGQWGRKWNDTGNRNVYLSIVIKPEILNSNENIVRFTAHCVCLTLKKYDVLPKIKEPNDIIINNKKICGILAESVTKGDKLKGIVIGVGVNLNTSKECLDLINQPATSLNLERGKDIDKTEFIQRFLHEFEINYPLFIKKEINISNFIQSYSETF